MKVVSMFFIVSPHLTSIAEPQHHGTKTSPHLVLTTVVRHSQVTLCIHSHSPRHQLFIKDAPFLKAHLQVPR